MGKGKNIVERAKERASITLVLVIAAGWILVAGNTLLNNDLIEQEALVQSAEKYRNEQLYVLAVQGYQEALSNYQTERNDEYEKSLLNLYQEAGMTEEYYSLIESRAEQGRAEAEEYLIHRNFDGQLFAIDKTNNSVTVLNKAFWEEVRQKEAEIKDKQKDKDDMIALIAISSFSIFAGYIFGIKTGWARKINKNANTKN